MAKLSWSGTVTSVQPRIRLMRSFDERAHGYLGYVVRLDGTVGDDLRQFAVALGPAAQAKHEIRVGDAISGQAEPVADPRKETAEFYKVAKLKVLPRAPAEATTPPPWLDLTPPLPTYRARGHRRLAARTYGTSTCSACMWGCRMPVEITIDPWNPGNLRYRVETFCYGPLSCPGYRAGPMRTVPGRKGMKWTEPDWLDDEEVSHRGRNE